MPYCHGADRAGDEHHVSGSGIVMETLSKPASLVTENLSNQFPGERTHDTQPQKPEHLGEKQMVRARGLEPPILSEPDPKSGASAIPPRARLRRRCLFRPGSSSAKRR